MGQKSLTLLSFFPPCRGECIREGLDPHDSWVGEQCQPCGAPQPMPCAEKAELRWGTSTASGDAATPHSAQGSESAAHQECWKQCSSTVPRAWSTSKQCQSLFSLIVGGLRWGGRRAVQLPTLSCSFLLGSQPGISCTELQDLSVRCRWSYLRSLKNGVLDD